MATRFPFPAVLKWKDPNTAAATLGPLGIELVKAEFAYTAEEFLAIVRRYAPVGIWPLVQRLLSGRWTGPVLLHA